MNALYFLWLLLWIERYRETIIGVLNVLLKYASTLRLREHNLNYLFTVGIWDKYIWVNTLNRFAGGEFLIIGQNNDGLWASFQVQLTYYNWTLYWIYGYQGLFLASYEFDSIHVCCYIKSINLSWWCCSDFKSPITLVGLTP